MTESRPILIDVPERLVGERIVVRRWYEADAPPLFSLIDESRDHLKQWLPWPDSHRTVDDTRAFVRRCIADWTLRADLAMGIFDTDGRLLGSVALRPHDWRIPSFEIGYWIGVAYEGKGYVSEAVRLISRLAFETLGAKRVFIRCDPRNHRSAAVASRCGFVLEGTLRSDCVAPDDSIGDTQYWSMLLVDFATVRSTW